MYKAYRQWRQRQSERALAKWKTTRKKGRSHYISGIALFWCLTVIGLNTLTKLALKGEFDPPEFVCSFPFFFLGGLLIGNMNWNAMEKEFKRRHPESEAA